MSQLNCLLCLDTLEGDNFAHNYLTATQIIHLYDLLVPKDRNYQTHRQDLVANCPPEDNNGFFTLCHNCSFATTQVEQIREKISQLEEEKSLKVEEIRSKMILSSDVKDLGPAGLGQIRFCFLTCLSSDDGGIQEDDDFQVKVELEEEDYDYEEDGHFLGGDDNKVDISSPVNHDDPDFSHSSDDDESSSFLITPDNMKKKKKRKSVQKRSSKTTQKSLPKVSTRSKTIKKPDVPIFSERKTRSSTGQTREVKYYAKTPQISSNSSEDVKPVLKSKIRGVKKQKPLKRWAKKKDLRFVCPICSKMCHKACILNTHMLTKHETKVKTHFCPKCEKGFTLEENLQRHVYLHEFDDTKPFSCGVCEARFAGKDRLDRHALTHGRTYRCDRCGKEYNSKDRFDSHVRTHTGEKPYKCEQCSEAFIDYPTKKRHIDHVHKGQETCECPICGKKILTTSLKSHMELTHEKKKNYSCDDCGEKFKQKDTLDTHRVKEHNADSLICDECGATFATRRGLNRHRLNHSTELKYICDTCGARFRAQHQLRYHIQSHAGQEIICQHCSKAFLHAPHLAEHIKRIHTADYVPKTPFECSYCKKRFSSKKDRACHIRQHHTGERPFVCRLCGKGYAVETTLTLHLKGVHRVDVEWKRATGWKKSKRDDFSGVKEPEEN